MLFDPILADIRFGTGLSPYVPPPGSAEEMLDRLGAPDRSAQLFPIPRFSEARPNEGDLRLAVRSMNTAESDAASDAARVEREAVEEEARLMRLASLKATIARGVLGDDPFRERLTAFWANHFTVAAKYRVTQHLITPFVEEAIRPNMMGRFADLLIAVTLHPMMVVYLDQHRSVGPNSQRGQQVDSGLNENLAREVLELHTLGVGGGYNQEDVRQFAELLTGIYWNHHTGLQFRTNWSEPGDEVVLGRTYSGETLRAIKTALEDLAIHPSTTANIARKLAVHFVSDDPDPDLIGAISRAYARSGGDLTEAYRALLTHPAAWAPERSKVKRPLEFMQSSLRALGVDHDRLMTFGPMKSQHFFVGGLNRMGHTWERPLAPNGWPEAAEAWITPQFLAGRVTWALSMPEELMPQLPDPRDFVRSALGPDAPQPVEFAASAAETRAAGIGLVLASAAFQRR